MKLININNLSKTYHTPTKEIKTLDNISFDINENEILSIIGPSGCGKTTLFNILTKSIDYNGSVKLNKKLRIGYMMQDDAILPWLTVFENAILFLKIEKNINEESINYVNDLLKKYDLFNFKNEYPTNLSGGMKQRLSLIRTLAIKPNILLLDEPFSKLDINTRNIITDDVYNIIKELKITTILITHDIKEAISISDRIIILSNRPSHIKKILITNNTNIPSETIISEDKYNYIRSLLNE